MKRYLTFYEVYMMTKYAWSLVGIGYKFGGNVPQDGGMDCSAYALELLRSVHLWGVSDARAQDIFDQFETVYGVPVGTKLKEGDFLFFGKSPSQITHVAYVPEGGSGTHMLEAGGDDKTGMIRLRPVDWRKDLMGILRFTK